ncbi:Aminoglycoside phosphotransferase [Penicillium griseofulvum]|uniref:Aminoglycoside phosphotransferase n=1 Tax=Penicillium patulum TaxID=5078 RepID=A0A135L8R2_PENPA|nr:Aminoglycoside phosphotransferase [Penicillium griseofulvum]KXG45349.1 Aminoglycoside phosphotransferase [Penicillium griseofulvum]
MGGMNYHIEISFNDGVSWLARIRRFNATSPPLELRNYIMHSEVATLKFLSNTTVPAPKVYEFNVDETNPVGVAYILMEKMPGKSLDWSLATDKQKRKVIDQLVDIYIELQTHPFDTMGSLVMDEFGSQHAGPFASESMSDYTDSLKILGPFSSLEGYYTAHIELILDLIIRQELYALRPVDAFLIHLYLLENLSAILNNDLDDGKFYLKHADEKGDHILVDDEFNITGIVDWEWAHTGPRSMAFNSPIALLPVALFYDGDNHLSEDEMIFSQLLEGKGHPDLGGIVQKGRLLHRLHFCCGYDSRDWDGYVGIFMGLVRALRIEDSHSNWETWKVEAMERFGGDYRLKSLVG